MIFWNVGKLGDELREGRVSAAQKTRYFIVYSVVMLLFVELVARVPKTYNVFDNIASVFALFATVVGTWLCHKANSQGDNLNFIERFVCLSLPTGVRVFVTTGVLFILLISAEGAAGISAEQTTPLQSALFIVGEFVYYLWLRRALLRTSGAIDEFGYATRLAND